MTQKKTEVAPMVTKVLRNPVLQILTPFSGLLADTIDHFSKVW